MTKLWFYEESGCPEMNSNKEKCDIPVFSRDEYTYLREEIIQRQGKTQSLSNTALITILSAWAAGLTFQIALSSKEMQFNWIYEDLGMHFLRALIFAAPVFFLLPLAIKSGENMRQTASLSAYIRVFFEYPIRPGEEQMNWEITNSMFSDIGVDRKRKSALMRLYNTEYFILAVISFAVYVLFGIIDVAQLLELEKVGEIFGCAECLFISIYAIVALCALASILAIMRSSSIKKSMMEWSQKYIEGYLNRAVELHVIAPEQLEKARAELLYSETSITKNRHLNPGAKQQTDNTAPENLFHESEVNR